MSAPLPTRFDDTQLKHIIDQAMIYICACPAQVASQILQLRQLHAYQHGCLKRGAVPDAVHEHIAAATEEAHARMEDCLDEARQLEGGDRERLEMPAGLRRQRDQILEQG